MNTKVNIDLLFKLAISLFSSMLISMDLNASRAQRKKTFRVFAEVKDEFFWMKST
jgi:hypothetical protein